MSKVMIHPATYEGTHEAVERAFEIFPLKVEGKKVLIKPNVLRASEAREGIVTHPAVLRSVVEKVQAMGPLSIVVGDNPGVFCYGANEESFKKTGLLEASGPHYRNIGDDSVEVKFNAEFTDKVSISRALIEADIVISLPKFKTHGLTVLTGAIKNSYGYLPGAQKARLHKVAGSAVRFHEVIVDVFLLRVPDLFIMDAVVGMEGNGPASPDLREIGLILASDNGVALDATVARMMGIEPGLLRFLRKAQEKGLGEYDIDSIEVIGQLTRLPDFRLPPLGGEAILQNEPMQEFLHSRMIMRPKVNTDWCTSCGACVNQCPVSALSMGDRIPEVDAYKCIACFCCQEICPKRAIALSAPASIS